jgi:hypothetical protein
MKVVDGRQRRREACTGRLGSVSAGTAEGLRRVEQGHARGKIVITVA